MSFKWIIKPARYLFGKKLKKIFMLHTSNHQMALYIILTGVTLSASQPKECKEVGFIRIPGCRNATLDELQQNNSQCGESTRILKFTQWLDSIGKPCSTIVKDINSRISFFNETTRYPITYPEVPFLGRTNAPVRITVYISMSCPMCKRLCRDLSDSLRNRVQKDIAMYVKPFSTTMLERAFVATGKWQKQSDLIRMLVPVKTRIDLPLILRIADSLGVPANALTEALQDKSVIAVVDSSRAEALRNGVTITPTFFINGKRYQGYKDARWVLDAAEYELEK